jgi:hypothetical protein
MAIAKKTKTARGRKQDRARVWDAIAAFIAEVHLASGSDAAASSKTDFINSISSG